MFKFGLLLLAGVAVGHPYGVYNNYNQPGGQRHGVPAYNHGGYGYGAPVVQQQQGYFGAGFNPSQQAQYSPYNPSLRAQPIPYNQFSQNTVGANFYQQENTGNALEEDTYESVPYTVIENFGTYELREYPAAKFACVKSEVDNSEDPLAGSENMNPFEVMKSKQWKKAPTSLMFIELFKYISGVNKEGQEIEMTIPAPTHHSIKKKQVGGDVEVQEMCFYITSEFQANPPQPLDNSPVFIFERPAMKLYARQFGGFPLTSASWIHEKQILENALVGKYYHDSEYYTAGYSSPWDTNRRNEVWIQCLEPAAPVVAAVVAEVEDIDNKKAEVDKSEAELAEAEEEEELATEELDANAVINTRTEESEDVEEAEDEDNEDDEDEEVVEEDEDDEADADTKAANTDAEESVEADEAVVADADAAVADADA
ncbi:uncharacterized protein LOC111699075 [Eurytemora carolleeae]|uniref:uncharacterized protein LOC111699075 n=1 Tax=Eurytemora carolleeae TaxID=1294199 RepID=UPI000C75CD9F|nr:uncharacterized protein LOC111699075 [Eurytemora carolleeae]|eukprot:XP_023325404.1 uncharacterized protein LOC111699075 [Eurytemora affinis]